jgi:hypothetical protein
MKTATSILDWRCLEECGIAEKAVKVVHVLKSHDA